MVRRESPEDKILQLIFFAYLILGKWNEIFPIYLLSRKGLNTVVAE